MIWDGYLGRVGDRPTVTGALQLSVDDFYRMVTSGSTGLPVHIVSGGFGLKMVGIVCSYGNTWVITIIHSAFI